MTAVSDDLKVFTTRPLRLLMGLETIVEEPDCSGGSVIRRVNRRMHGSEIQKQILHSAYPMDTGVHGAQGAPFRMTPTVKVRSTVHTLKTILATNEAHATS
jgi:hypothetical protein